MNDEQRAEAILREVSRRVEREVGRQPTYRASLELFCCVRVAAEDAAEVVRLLEVHRRVSGLTPENLTTLKQYRTLYEVAQLVLMEYYSGDNGSERVEQAKEFGNERGSVGVKPHER